MRRNISFRLAVQEYCHDHIAQHDGKKESP